MTALAIALTWAAARGTALAGLGVMLYLTARRRGPASGSRAAASALAGLVGISALAVSPWPRWWDVDAPRVVRPEPPPPVVAKPPAPAPARESKAPAGPSLRDRLAAKLRPSPSGPKPHLDQPAPPPVHLLAERSVETVPAPPTAEPPRAADAPMPAGIGWSRTLVLIFASGVGVGLARLLAGLWAVRRLRDASRVVDDAALLGLLEAMRAEMGIGCRVEIRETAELSGPATTGWTRPSLYLPASWESWSEAERRVVLAHELAHVGRGDYPAWVAAQLGVILHFHQPMAHWLVGRLRLEQELAADDWGARHAGGRPTYLATLAALALRQEVRPAAWPVRSLFPTRKTLIRRIEMLRKTDRTIPAPTWASRAFAPAVIVAAVFLLAGLRGPMENSNAQDPPARPADEAAAVKPAPAAIDPSLIPADAPLIAAFRPADLAKLPELKALYEEFTRQGEIKLIVDMAEPESIEQVAVVLFRKDLWHLKDMKDESELADAGALIIRTNKPREWKAWLLLAGMLSGKAAHQGKEYYRVCAGENKSGNPADGPSLFAYYQPDHMTVVAASEAAIKAMIAGEKPKGESKWGEAIRRAARGHAFLAIDVAWAREQVKPLMQAEDKEGRVAMMLAPISPLQDLVERQVVTLDASDGLAITSENFCRDEAGAERVRRTIDALVVLGQNAVGPAFDAFRNTLNQELGPMAPLLELGEQAVKRGVVEREGTIVRFRTSVKGPLVQKLRSVVEAK